MSLETGIWASRLGFEPRGGDLSLKAGIWASKGGMKEKEKEEKKEEKVLHL